MVQSVEYLINVKFARILFGVEVSRRVFGCDRMLRMLHVDVGCRRRGARNVGARVALAVFLWCSVDICYDPSSMK